MLENQRWLSVVHQIKSSHFTLALYLSVVSLYPPAPLYTSVFILFQTFQGLSHFFPHSTTTRLLPIHFAPSYILFQLVLQPFRAGSDQDRALHGYGGEKLMVAEG